MTMHNYTDYQAMILKLAHIWTNKGNGRIEFEELVAEGNLAFCIADQKFRPDNGNQFSTYLYTVASNAMCDLAMGNWRKMQFESPSEEIDVLPLPDFQTPETQTRLKQWTESLSKESQFLIKLVWETPGEIVQWAQEETYHPRNTQDRLARYLRGLNWKWADIQFCFQEIKEALKEGI